MTENNTSRRDLLAALGAVGAFTGVTSAAEEEDPTGQAAQATGTNRNENGNDAEVLNHRSESVSGTVMIRHTRAKKGPEKSFDLTPRSESGEEASHKKEIKNLPKMGGNYEIRVDIDDGQTNSREFAIAKADRRGRTVILIDEGEIKIGRLAVD